MAFQEITGPLDSGAAAPAPGGFTPVSGPLDHELAPPAPPTMNEQVGHQFQRLLRQGYEGITGTGRVLADAPFALGNLGIHGFNAAMGTHIPPYSLPSHVENATLNKLLPLSQDQSPMEVATGVGGRMLAGGMDPLTRAVQAVTSRAFPAPPAQQLNTAMKDTLKELQDAGISLPPSRVQGSTAPSRVMEQLSGKPQVSSILADKNQPIFQTLARKEIGLPEGTDLTGGALQQNIDQWAAKGYRPLEALPAVGIGSQFRTAMSDILQKYAGDKSFDSMIAKVTNGHPLDPVEKVVYDALFTRDPTTGVLRYKQSYTGRDLVQMSKILRNNASDNFSSGSPNTNLALAQKATANALEDNADYFLSHTPNWRAGAPADLVTNFRQARTEIAKNMAVRDMLVDPNTGILDPGKAFAMSQRGDKLTGGLSTIAKAGSPVFGPSTRAPLSTPTSGWEQGASYGAAANYATGHAGYGTALAALPIARTMGRHYIATPFYQNQLYGNALGTPGPLGTPAGQRALMSPAALLPFFNGASQ